MKSFSKLPCINFKLLIRSYWQNYQKRFFFQYFILFKNIVNFRIKLKGISIYLVVNEHKIQIRKDLSLQASFKQTLINTSSLWAEQSKVYLHIDYITSIHFLYWNMLRQSFRGTRYLFPTWNPQASLLHFTSRF